MAHNILCLTLLGINFDAFSFREAHGSVSTNSHHHAKGGLMSTKGPPTSQSRSSSSSSSHKAYQQQHVQQNAHFQNTKDNNDSSAPNFQISRDNKDSNYLKQHPPHMDRDGNKDNNYHGQYSQSSSMQHQNYSHKLDYSHRDGSRTNHNNQGSSSLSQAHHSQSHGSSNQRDFSQREGMTGKDTEAQVQPPKKDMSTSIRDIIGQTLPQTDSHSMTNERKDVRDKSRGNHIYGNMTLSNNRPEVMKNGREQSKLFHDAAEKKVDDFRKDRVFKKDEEDSASDLKSIEPMTMMKAEKFDEADSIDNFTAAGSNNWNYDFGFKSEKKDASASMKVDSGMVKTEVDKTEAAKTDAFSSAVDINTNKAVHSMKGIYDSKYKVHHYPSGNKNSDVSQFKNDKQSAQCSSDITKKFNDRLHEKHRKGESDRISHLPEAGAVGDISKHKLKEMQEKHKVLMPGQQHIDQKLKERSSPSKYTKMKVASRPSNLDFLKSDSGHFSLDATVNSVESDKNVLAVRAPTSEDSTKISNINSFHKQTKTHEFGGLSSSLSDSMKTSKTCSIFSPDSKIPPQNILSTLENESKKNVSISHRTHPSSTSSPTSTPVSVKSNVPTPLTATITNSVSTGSLFSPPLSKPSQPVAPRHRTSSSGSEPELILTKMEETPGYENVAREMKIGISSSDKNSERDRSVDGSGTSLFDFDLKGATSKPADVKLGRSDPSHFATAKQVPTTKIPSEIRSDLGAVIYPNNPKSATVSKQSQSFSLTEQKLSLSNSVSTVNLSGIEKMVDTSISPAKQTNQYGAGTSVKSALPMNINMNVHVSSSSNAFASAASGQTTEVSTDQNMSKINPTVANQEIIDVEDISHSDGKKKSEKKKKKDKHKHKDKDKEKDRSERKKEKKKHKEKDKEKMKEKDKHKDKDRSREKEKHREKEIDVVNSEAVNSEAPIKITIPKDKISGGLKIKIPKDYLKKEGEVDSPKFGTSGELKIKISKDKFSNVSTYKDESKTSKKRERSPKTTNEMPYPKIMKTEKKVSSSSRSNGTDGSSRNSSSHRHSVSENGSCIDISSLYDFPFDFEENGEGIIKTPDYDFEALNAPEYPQDVNPLPEDDLFKNSQNESLISVSPVNAIGTPPQSGVEDPCRDPVPKRDSSPGVLPEEAITPPKRSPTNSSPLKIFPINGGESLLESKLDGSSSRTEDSVNPGDCDVLKNYKSILDSHSRRCEQKVVGPDENPEAGSAAGNDKPGVKDSEPENPNYYNKYFKKDGNARTRLRDEKKPGKAERTRFEDRSRFYEQRYRNDYERSRHYRDFREYPADSQYYFEGGGDDRRFEYQKYVPNHFFNMGKPESEAVALNYDINANESGSVFPQSKTQQFVCDSSINSSLDINLQYPFGYYNNYMYPNGGYRFYGNVPYVNLSLIQQQPTPPGTGEASVHLDPPPLPLEPPPDLPPPPETPPPKHS